MHVSPPAATEVVGADDLSVQLGGLPVLRGISLSVTAGEGVALLGGNGSGKSTLVRALLGLVPIARGSSRLFGQPLTTFRQWSRIGYVPQRSPLTLGSATAREVVSAGRLSRRRPFVPLGGEDRQAVRDALTAVGMLPRAGSELRHLSGGQQQRVLIARALAGEPDLLVLDEPAAGVDRESHHVLADLLSTRLSLGAAVLVVLHELGTLAPLIDRAVLLREGRVAHDGPLEMLTGHHLPGRHENDPPDPSGWLGGTIER